MTDPDIRWQQRFLNFERVFLLLKDAIEQNPAQLSHLEKEGIVQRFEYTFELAWNVLRDRMEHDGITLDQISPRGVIRQAFEAKYISDAQNWLKMTTDRNLMSHTYDFAKFESVIQSVRDTYLPMLETWYKTLLEESNTP